MTEKVSPKPGEIRKGQSALPLKLALSSDERKHMRLQDHACPWYLLAYFCVDGDIVIFLLL